MGDLLSDSADVAADNRGAFPHRLGDGHTESFANGFLQHHRSLALQRVDQERVVDGDNDDAFVERALDRFKNEVGFRIVYGGIAKQHERAVDLFSNLAGRLDHADRIFPPVEPRDLRNNRTVCGNTVIGKALRNLAAGEFAILRRERIDRGRDDVLRNAERLLVLGQAHHGRIVVLDEITQIIPYRRMGCGKIDMALPDPSATLAFEMPDQRQRLRVVDDDRVTIFEMQPQGILARDLFVDLLFLR